MANYRVVILTYHTHLNNNCIPYSFSWSRLPFETNVKIIKKIFRILIGQHIILMAIAFYSMRHYNTHSEK